MAGQGGPRGRVWTRLCYCICTPGHVLAECTCMRACCIIAITPCALFHTSCTWILSYLGIYNHRLFLNLCLYLFFSCLVFSFLFRRHFTSIHLFIPFFFFFFFFPFPVRLSAPLHLLVTKCRRATLTSCLRRVYSPASPVRAAMSARDFVAALEAPDHSQLQSLASKEPVVSPTLFDAAAAYLAAFCSNAQSSTRKRWIGLVLRNIIRASPELAKKLAHLQPGLKHIGNTLSSSSITGDVSTVAGLIVQVCLENSLTFQNFWDNDAVLGLFTTFPRKTSPRWLKELHSFVHVLRNLLGHEESLCTDMFPARSLTMPEEDAWPGEMEPCLFAGDDTLIIVNLDGSTSNMTFVDVPLNHITGLDCRLSTLQHDRASKRQSDAWDLILEFNPQTGVYQVNHTERHSKELTITFPTKAEAERLAKRLTKIASLSPLRKTSARATRGRDAFGFPEQQERFVRPSNHKSKTASHGPGHANIISQKGKYAKTKAETASSEPIAELDHVSWVGGTGHMDDNESKLRSRQKVKEPHGYTENKHTDVEYMLTNDEKKSVRSSRLLAQGSPSSPSLGTEMITDPKPSKLPEGCSSKAANAAHCILSLKTRTTGLLVNSGQTDLLASCQQKGTPDAKQVSPSAKEAISRSSTKRSEATTIRGIDPEEGSKDDYTTPHKFLHVTKEVLGKRSPSIQAPSTPPSKRVRGHNIQSLDSICQGSAHVPLSNRRDRVLEDPLSPCGQRIRPRSTPPRKGKHDMRPPLHPTNNDTALATTPRLHKMNISKSSRVLDNRRTPIHHTERSNFDESNIELLSSNSKPTPASPHAESTAISGHADPRRVRMEKEMADSDIRRTDPFKETVPRKTRATAFTRRLSKAIGAADSTNNKLNNQDVNGMHFDGDKLVDEEPLPTIKQTPVHLRSSPPPLYHDSPSTPGSSSFGDTEPKTSTPASASDIEGLDWEASLQPHQRTLRDRLFRVSNRVMHCIVDNEAIIEDIAETYHEDGESLLQSLVDRRSAEIDTLSKEMDNKAGQMKRSCDQVLKHLTRDGEVVQNMTMEG
ncbi:unnamed protein product [Periconia digitata]|uniref:Uncharacterized protein n=1 Tax=Periconia digitata TaxID=1303443 RepID=A0A9W4XUZ8_9PLEO|nr:unnamed protein product [Periconia digitata]